MPGLASIQLDILRALAGMEPPWTLTGGGALVAVHLNHRSTRDLDLFWHHREFLERLPDAVEARLRAAGFQVARLEVAPAFVRLDVRRGSESTVVDLVADVIDVVRSPVAATVGGVSILVDTPHEILVNKLNTLLSRSELRDLVDVRALLAAGGDLEGALVDAATKDGGFSAMTCAWVLDQLPVARLARLEGYAAEEAQALQVYRDALVARLKASSHP